MTISAGGLFFCSLVYLLALFAVAFAAERRWLPPAIARHPLTYILSLGVYATTWSFYGSVGFAESNGFLFLAVYLGLTLAFVLAPILLSPILRLVREYQLTSVADLFAFRFRSQTAGILVTLFTLTGTLPYISLQIRAVTESARLLNPQIAPDALSFWFCIIIVLFSILFGTRRISPREKHEGLVVAIAFESIIKLLALLLVAGFSIVSIFGGFDGVQQWLNANPQALQRMTSQAQQGPWISILVLSFAAAFLLPRQFHMLFTENISPQGLRSAAWGFPLLMLLMNLAIPIVLWAAAKSELSIPADYFVIGLAQKSGSAVFAGFVFLGGVSAASAMIIVSTLALAGMTVNHLILPAMGTPNPRMSFYRWLQWGRRIIIALLVLAGYAFFRAFETDEELVQLGLISFVAIAQFLPGIVGTLFWSGANRFGFIAGLTGGALTWFVVLILPLITRLGTLDIPLPPTLWELAGQDKWTFSTLATLSVNGFLFVLFSVITRQSAPERETAALCAQELMAPYRSRVRLSSPKEFVPALANALGRETAEFEVRRAQHDLRIRDEETDRRVLGRLRERIERNLSGLIGPHSARDVVNIRLPVDTESLVPEAERMRSMEETLEASRSRLRGLAAQLDALRRYHRQVLEELPVGVCSVSPDGEITSWNRVMESVSGIPKNDALGSPPSSLKTPWSDLIDRFLAGTETHIHKQMVSLENETRWFSLSKAAMKGPGPDNEHRGGLGTSVLFHDVTEVHRMEDQLAHSERLASIGRFASGVAHEIGNPVTGIASLAQNLEAEISDPEINSEIQSILEQTYRINNIVQTLVNFSRRGESDLLQTHRFPLRACLEEAGELVRMSHRGKDIDLAIECASGVELQGDRQRISQVFVNILSNAYDASDAGDLVRIIASPAADQTEITVRDFGHGMTDEISDRIFEPFMTTKQPGEGTGLGMALTYGIIRDHGGSIEVESAPGAGTEVRIMFPTPDK